MRLSSVMIPAVLVSAAVGCQQRNPDECVCKCVYGNDVAPLAPAAAVAPAPPPVPTPALNVIAIGHVASLTGSEATLGISADKGIQLAVEEQNRSGGVRGKQIVLKTLDDQGKPTEAAAAAQQLVTRHQVAVILGSAASSRSLAIAPVADASRIPQIAPSSTHPQVTKDGAKTRPYVFRVCFSDPFPATVMARFTREVLKLHQVAVLRDTAAAYSMSTADAFVEKLKALGGGIVADLSYRTGDRDFKTQLTTLQGLRYEAIYVPGYYGEVALIARQARELGIRAPLLGAGGWDSAKLYELAQGALDGSYFSSHFSADDPSLAVQDFVKKYKAAYGTLPDTFAALGYDATKVAFDAMARAKELTGPAIRDALEATRGFQAVTGAINIDADHNTAKPAVVLAIDKNRAYYAATITP